MSHTIAEYLNLVAREHANKPKYIAWLTALIQPVIDSQNFNDSVRDAFDLDTAIGAQLDILGQWIGKSRIVPVPIAGLYFTLDTGPGLDAGMLIGPYDPLTGLEALHDDIYRGVLRARVDYNRWDGSIPMAVQSMSEAFPSSASDPFYAAFVAYDPYYINIMGTMTYYSLWNTLRAFDFSGNAPFVNPLVNQSDIAQIQAHGTTLDGEYITSAGFANCVEKKTINGVPTTMIRYNAGDVITAGTCRTKVKTYAIPNRVFARWDIDVAFGNADGVNDWTLTNSGDSPIVFWSITSPDQLNGPLGLQVDTDSIDSTKLMISIHQRVGPNPNYWIELALFHGVERHSMIPIVVELFLDERADIDGGMGFLNIWINDTLAVGQKGPTLAWGSSPQFCSMDMYLWNETAPYAHTRASFWKTARMSVYSSMDQIGSTQSCMAIYQTGHDSTLIIGICDLGNILTPIHKAVFNAGIIDFVPAGVNVTSHFITTHPAFALDAAGGATSGLDSGVLA